MLPPSPPSPPLGPPRGTNFSLRKAMQPCPPSPALTVILASSINIFLVERGLAIPLLFEGGETAKRAGWLFDRLDADEPAGTTFVFKFNDAGDLRKQRVIFTDADIHAGFELGPA